MSEWRGKDAGFEFGVPITRVWKDDGGEMRFEGIASSTSVDKQHEKMTPRAIESMARHAGIDLLPSHNAGPLEELGTVEETRADNEAFYVAGRLDESNPQARRLFDRLLAGRQYQLSVGGRVLKAYWGTDEDGEQTRFIDEVELDHVALCRPGKAANADTYLRAMAKSVEKEEPSGLMEAALRALRARWPFGKEEQAGSGRTEEAPAEMEALQGSLAELRRDAEALAKVVGAAVTRLEARAQKQGAPESLPGQEMPRSREDEFWKGVLRVER